MSGRARVPVGASERLGIFGGHHHQTLGGAGGARNAKEGLPKKCSNRSSDARGDGGIPLATHPQHQQQSSMVAGDARATPYGALSPGRRRSFATPYNGNPIAPERSEYESVSKGTPSDNSPASDNMKIDSCRSEISRSTHAGEQTWGTSSDLENMLELEHIIGDIMFRPQVLVDGGGGDWVILVSVKDARLNLQSWYTGHFPQTVLTHPEDSSVLIKCVGALLVIASFSDPHHQHLLRGHDMEISALAVSPFGSLVATGQSGSTRRKGFPAPVFLWDYVARRALFELQGLTEGVNHLSFSPDQKFLLGCGKNRLTYVWDTDTGELVTGKQFPESATLAQWCEVKVSGRRRTYPVCLCVGKDVLALELNFDAARRQWNMSGGPMATPSSGLRRNYYCSALLSGGKFLICGTEVGDMVVYGIDAKVFRASVPVCAGGLLSICTDPSTGSVYCGAGDGALRKISGHDMVWQQEMETRLDGGVVSLSLQADGSELLAGTQEGSVYRVLLSDLSASKVSSSHKSPVLAVACGSRVDSFATCSRDGKVRVWDLCDFGVVAEALPKQRTWGNAEESACGGVSALCVCWLREEAVLTGWSDCSVGCYDAATGTLRWEISKAHRAPVTCCAVRSDSSACFFVTGSEDGSVSIWDLRTRELLLQFAEHQKGVRAVLVDVASPDLLHSVGADCTVFTYDLRKERRTVAHMMRTGAFQGVTQRMDSENELITCDANGRLLMWDCDYRDPVQVIQDPSQQRLRCVSVSISGRYLVIAGDGEVLKVLDLANNCETVACGRAHAGPVTSVQWTKDDRQLISAAEDCTLAIWNFFGTDAPPPTDR